MHDFTIRTQRLLIRTFQKEDWPAVYAYTADRSVMHFIPGGRMTEAETQSYVNRQADDAPEAYAVLLPSQERLIGHISFHPWFAPRTYEIGWVFHPDYHGRGYATEAALAMLDYGFETRNVHRIIATCQPENPASWRVMEKLGMTREGHFRQCIEQPGGIWWDEYFYAALKAEWQEITRSAASG